jgi:rhamnose utilization protein RhaD (predicted bifunctional aldolase and dehydrogenase)
MTVANSLRESVTDFSAMIGADSMLVQGAGGNVSWKDDDTLWVKASGTWLANAKDKDIFVPVDLHGLQKEIKAGNFAAVPKVRGESKLRPSIETLLHALMPHRVVVHVHAIEALAYLVRENAVNEINEKLGTNNHLAIVNYQKPGEALARAVGDILALSPDVQILLLKNHGVVIGGNDITEIETQLNWLLSKLNTNYIPNVNGVILQEPICVGSENEYLPLDIPGIHNLAILKDLFIRVKNDWALYPDHLVFLGHRAYCYDSIQALQKDLSSSATPELVFVKNLGVFTKSVFSIAKQAQLRCYLDVIVRQPKKEPLQVLSEKEIAELLEWDAERYRQQMLQ